MRTVDSTSTQTSQWALSSFRVFVIAEVALYREALVELLKDQPRIEVVGTASSQSESLKLIGASGSDVVVLDMMTSGALQLVRELRREAPHAKVVGFAVDDTDSAVLGCAEAGIDGYVTADGNLVELLHCIEGALRGEFVCTPRNAAALARRVREAAEQRPAPRAKLTARESGIIELMDDGLSNKEIAERLSIELSTVKNHVHNILDKLEARSRGEAVALLRRDSHVRDLVPVVVGSSATEPKDAGRPDATG